MKIKILALSVPFLIAIPVLAHHSFAMFELTKDVTYEGTVVEYRWENPHTHIILKVDEGAADPVHGGNMGHRRRRHQHHGPPRVDAKHLSRRATTPSWLRIP